MARSKNKDGDNSIGITFSELMVEVERMRKCNYPTIHHLTDQQKQLIITCRNNPVPVSYSQIVKLWELAGWGTVTISTLTGWYTRYLK